MKIQNKGAVLVQIAPLFISQPRNQNQSINGNKVVGAVMLLPKFLSRKISPEKSLDFLSQSAEHLGIVQNKVSRGIVAHARRCAQTNCSAPKRSEVFLHFTRSCVLGLYQNPAPAQRCSKGGWQGAGYKKVGQFSQELGRPTF